jgi:DNA-binding SARP family transcriptional activator
MNEGAAIDPSGRSLTLHLLGGFRLESGARIVPDTAWQRRKSKTLLRILAAVPDHRLHAEQLQEMLWPDQIAESANNSLRKALHEVRHVLEPDLAQGAPSAYVTVVDGIVWLQTAAVWIDADAFERHAREALASGDLPALEAATGLYGGELLPEDRYEDWAEIRRTALANLYLETLLGLAALLERRGEWEGAIRRLEAALAVEITREDVHRELMRLHAAYGSKHRALRQYQLCRQALSEHLDAEPEPATEELHSAIRAGRAGKPAQKESSPEIPLPAAVHRAFLTPLIGRDEALRVLRESAERLRSLRRPDDEPRSTVLIGGEAGIGKTRLMAELAREQRARGWLVLWGASYEPEGMLPYGALLEALDSWMRTRLVQERERLGRSYPELTSLLPSLAPYRTRAMTSLTPQSEQARLFSAIQRLLTEMSATRPLLLLLDDLHAADPASLQVLHQLIRTAPDHPWMIVGTYREEEAASDGDLYRLLLAVRRSGLVQQLDLLRLARSDADRLTGVLLGQGAPAPSILDALYARSRGNPLFLGELIQTARALGELSQVGGQWQVAAGDRPAPVPQQVGDLVEARIRTLGEPAKRTLDLAAVAGMEVTFGLLLAAGQRAYGPDLPEHVLLDALDRALETRILEERGDGYTFRHPLFQEALYDRLSGARRMRLHRVLAETIERDRPEDIEALAIHYSRSDERERALVYLERAGDRAASVYAPAAAERHYRDLLQRLEELGRVSERPRVQEKLGAVLLILARFDEALRYLAPAAAAYRAAGDIEAEGRVSARIGMVHRFTRSPEEAVPPIRAALNRLAGTPASIARASLQATLAHVLFAGGRYRESAEEAASASAMARALGEKTILADAELRRGTALRFSGRQREGAQVQAEAVALAEQADALDVLGTGLNNLADAYMLRGEFARSRACLDRAAELGERVGNRYGTITVTELSIYMGAWADARRSNEYWTETATRLNAAWYAAYPLLDRGLYLLHAGDWEPSRQALEQAIALAEVPADTQALVRGQRTLAELEILEGNCGAAVARLEPLLSRETVDQAATWLTYAWGLVEIGELSRAQEILARSLEQSREDQNGLLLMQALRVRGLLLAAERRWDEAQSAFAGAAEMARQMPYPHAEARALCDSGNAYARAGDRARARPQLEAAARLFGDLGARQDLLRTQQALDGIL